MPMRRDMPVEAVASDKEEHRRYSHLEAFGRLMTGIAPWLELGPDDSDEGSQPLVDAAFLAHAIVRVPNELREKLAPGVRKNPAEALRSSQVIKPGPNNSAFLWRHPDGPGCDPPPDLPGLDRGEHPRAGLNYATSTSPAASNQEAETVGRTRARPGKQHLASLPSRGGGRRSASPGLLAPRRDDARAERDPVSEEHPPPSA